MPIKMFAHTNTHTSVHLKWHKTESITRFVCFVIVVGDEKCTAEVPTGSHIVNSAHFISQYKCCCYSTRVMLLFLFIFYFDITVIHWMVAVCPWIYFTPVSYLFSLTLVDSGDEGGAVAMATTTIREKKIPF